MEEGERFVKCYMYLKYGSASGMSLLGSLASDHITTAGLFLSLEMSSPSTSR